MRRATASNIALALVTGIWAAQASAQCAVTSPPTKFQPSTVGPGIPPKFNPGYTFTLDFTGSSRLIVQENYGYGVFDVSSPGAPFPIAYHDMEITIHQAGDAQSLVLGVGGGDDGQRALVGWKQSPYGTFSMRSNGTTFSFRGGYASSRPGGGLTIVQIGNRFFGFSLAQGGLFAADVTDAPESGYTSASSIPTEVVPGAPVNAFIKGLTRAGHFVVYSAGNQIVVVDVGSPGPGVSGFTSGYSVHSFTPTDFGLPSGTLFTSVAAAMHPDGKLYVAAESSAGAGSSGIALTRTSVNAINLTPVGSPFVPQNVTPSGAATMVATEDDVLALFWEIVSPDAKLVTLSANGWGTDLSPDAMALEEQLGNVSTPAMVRAKLQAGAIYQYVAASFGSFVMVMSCTSAPTHGDVNGDGLIDVSDILYLINFLFADGPAAIGPADPNADGQVNVSDVLYLIAYVFAGGPPPL